MKHMRMMWGCVAVIAVIAVVAISGFDPPSWTRLVIFAACPLMMIYMMLSMGKSSQDNQNPSGSEPSSSDKSTHPTAH